MVRQHPAGLGYRRKKSMLQKAGRQNRLWGRPEDVLGRLTVSQAAEVIHQSVHIAQISEYEGCAGLLEFGGAVDA